MATRRKKSEDEAPAAGARRAPLGRIGGRFHASPGTDRMIELNPVRQRIADLTGRLDALRGFL